MPPKPDKKTRPKAYAAWVKRQVKFWHPADDHSLGYWVDGKWVSTPDVLVPRNGKFDADE